MIARLLKALLCLELFAVLASAQTEPRPQPKPSPEQSEDVIKVYTELRQTDVMVFDSKGQFVDGLTRENFELKIDGKSAPITFFERVEAGPETKKRNGSLRAINELQSQLPRQRTVARCSFSLTTFTCRPRASCRHAT